MTDWRMLFCLQEIDLDMVGLHGISDYGIGSLTTYQRHLLQLGESHNLLLLNGLSCTQTLAASCAFATMTELVWLTMS